MTDWSLPLLLEQLHSGIEHRLATARQALAHSTTKGDATERVWLSVLQTYLPKRYCAERAHVIDSQNRSSKQLDVVVFDRQYSPLIFEHEGQTIIPAESVYAVFEAKQSINSGYVREAHEKVASVRALHRTSLPVPYVAGRYEPKPLMPILGGILTLDSDWNPPLGDPLMEALEQATTDERLDIGCVASHGIILMDGDRHVLTPRPKAATAFLLEFIARLQSLGTVPMIDTRAYARWL